MSGWAGIHLYHVSPVVTPGCRATGNLSLARNKDRLTALRRNQAVAK